jgi:Domain of unknown function (DUF4157)
MESDMGKEGTAKIGNDSAAVASKAMSRQGVNHLFRNGGQSLNSNLQAEMGARFGYDFSHVRLHADRESAEFADSIGANALTVGNHVIFGNGKYRPDDFDGRRLIVHELTHVVQQHPVPLGSSQSSSLEDMKLGGMNDAAEREAQALAGALPRGEQVVVRQRVSNTMQADWAGAGIGALVGGGLGALVGGLAGGPLGALIGGGIGLLAGAIIGGLAGGGMFPSYREIVADGDVQAAITGAWASTEAAATAASRREEGFWIRLNTQTKKYEFTGTVLGPSVGPGATGSVILGARPADVNPDTDNAIYTVGSFHTHTPTAFRPVGRAVGPSGADHAADTSDDVVGVVYDYTESPAGSGNVPAGHPIGSPAQSYHSGPNRRQKL